MRPHIPVTNPAAPLDDGQARGGPLRPCLVVIGGLPGVGKTTVCREVLGLRPMTWLRIDSIEQALRESGEMRPGTPGGAGYAAAAAVSRDVLATGGDVLAECVNPMPLTRRLWEATAGDLGCAFLGVELVCPDAGEHRRRVEGRASDIKGLVLPDWREVRTRDYEPWPEAGLRLDTARLPPAGAAGRIIRALSTLLGAGP